MSINVTPGVIYKEAESNENLIGNGSQIPIIIGKSSSATGDPTKIIKFKNYSQAKKSVANGGVGPEPETLHDNPLLEFLKQYFEEGARLKVADKGMPYVYVIDMGTAPTDANWTTAMTSITKKSEVEVEVYIGIEESETFLDLLEAINTNLNTQAEYGNLRVAYVTKYGATDAQLIALTDDTQAKSIQRSRIGLCEPLLFGKTVAKISLTPYYEEPGYTVYRSVNAGTFKERTRTEANALQNAGVIFNKDEMIRGNFYPKINLAVSTSWAKDDQERPNDAGLHARRNTDYLIRDIYDTCWEQIKRNETATNLQFLQTDINSLINTEIDKGNMMTGTSVTVTESDEDPYTLFVNGSCKPVNSTLAIEFEMYVSQPNATVADEL